MSRIDPIKEAQAAQALRASIALVDEGDEALALDMIEGETNLLETIDLVLHRIAVAKAGVAGLEAVGKDLDARKARYTKRIEADRALLEQAMSIAEIIKLERPLATLSLAERAPSLRIDTEADIPARFWKAGEPTLDKKGLLAALRERKAALDNIPAEGPERQAALSALPPDIPGAGLSNGAPSLTIRST